MRMHDLQFSWSANFTGENMKYSFLNNLILQTLLSFKKMAALGDEAHKILESE